MTDKPTVPFWDESPPDTKPRRAELPRLDDEGKCANCGFTAPAEVLEGFERVQKALAFFAPNDPPRLLMPCPECSIWFGLFPRQSSTASPTTLTENDQKHPGWVGVDFDGTLAHYTKWSGPDVLGEPIAPMVARVKRWLAAGIDVRIFTARVSTPGAFPDALGRAEYKRNLEARVAHDAIERWCVEHIGRKLPITCVKDLEMRELYDDRAVSVEMNTGRLLSRSTRGLPE